MFLLKIGIFIMLAGIITSMLSFTYGIFTPYRREVRKASEWFDFGLTGIAGGSIVCAISIFTI